MKIGELFVNLGIKGDAKSSNALGRVQGGLDEVKSAGLGAKAAIAAAVFGLERLMSSSTASGTNLLNFASITGLSAKRLQEWQWAALQAGVDAQELQSGVEGVQKTMTNMALGKGAPEGLGLVADMVGFDQERAQDTFYVLEQLQKFAQAARADVANTVLSGFGLSSNVIAAMRRNAFNPEIFRQAPVYSDQQISNLNKADAAWRGLGKKIQMAMGEFSADEGLVLIGHISKITDEVLKMTKAFMDLSKQLKVFELIGQAFEGWGIIFKGIADGTKVVSEGLEKDSNTFRDMAAWMVGMDAGVYGKLFGGQAGVKEIAKPNVSSSGGPLTTNNQSTVNQTLNFSSSQSDPQIIGDTIRKATRDAFRQMSTQGQEN